jgi:hypothetical protein
MAPEQWNFANAYVDRNSNAIIHYVQINKLEINNIEDLTSRNIVIKTKGQ